MEFSRLQGGAAPRTALAGFLILAFAVPLLHLPMLGLVPVSGDEANAWQCSLHPDWSYYDLPPIIVFSIGASTRLFGVNETAARLPALLTGLAISLALLAIGRRLFGDTRGPFWALVGLLATPLFSLGTLYTCTDIFLCFFTLVVPALAGVALVEDRPRLWLLVGLLGGLGGLAKFSAVLYVPPVLLLALFHPTGRRHLRRPEPYLGALLGLLAVSPNLIWAALHHMDNITFQLVDRQTRAPFTPRWLGEYLLPQFVLLSPILFPLLLVALAVETRRAFRERDLATLSLVLPADTYFIFFLLVALRAESSPHWAAPAAITGALVTARWVLRCWKEWRPARRRLVLAGLATGLFLSLSLHSLLFLYDRLPAGWAYNDRINTDALRDLRGWPELVAHLRSLEGKEFDPGKDPVVCDSFTTGSLIAFYSGGRYDPLLMASAGGIHGLTPLYWQNPARWSGRPGLYVGNWRKTRTREEFEQAYGSIRELESFTAGGAGAETPPGRTSQTWRLIRGERLADDPALWKPFLPEGRRRPAVAAP